MGNNGIIDLIFLWSRRKNTNGNSLIDNGVGIDNSLEKKKKSTPGDHESKGMKLTKERLGIDDSIKEEELPSGGTRITVKIPLL